MNPDRSFCSAIDPDLVESPRNVRSSPLRSPGAYGITVGTKIRIRTQNRIHHKLHPYASTDAEVIEVPIHPNTWYGVRLYDSRHVKIRKSAFDVAKDLPPLPKLSLPSSVEHPQLEYVKVVIANNAEVQNNFPELVGLQGQVIEIPRYSNLWFSVKLDVDGRVVKLLRTSLIFQEPSQEALVDKVMMSSSSPNSAGRPYKQAQQLTREELDTYKSWVGARVVIKSGKHKGVIGIAKDFAEGRFRIFAGEEEVYRKPKHVELYTNPSKRSAESFPTNDSKRPRKRSMKNIVGSYVTIVGGKHMGLRGYVRKGGNGYYSVEIRGHNGQPMIVMKRSNELSLVQSNSTYQNPRLVGQMITIGSGSYQSCTGMIQHISDGFFHVKLADTGETVKVRAIDLDFRSLNGQEDISILTAASILYDLISQNAENIAQRASYHSYIPLPQQVSEPKPTPRSELEVSNMPVQLPVGGGSHKI